MAYEFRTEVYRGNARVDNLMGEETEIIALTPALALGLGGGYGASISLPVVQMNYDILRHQTADGQPLPRFEEEQTGLGDASLMLQRMLVVGAVPGTGAWLGLGLTVPLGLERDYPQLEGMNYGEVLTLGSGTWDPLIVHGLKIGTDQTRFNLSFMGRFTLYENRFGYRAGSVVWGQTGVDHRLVGTPVSLLGNIGYRHQWRARRDGQNVLNSGGDWLSITPGIGWKFDENWRVKCSVELALWRNLYAGPEDIEQPVNGQTDADQRWLISLSYTRTK